MAREREQLPVSPPSVVLGYFGAAVARHPWLVLLSVTGPIALQLATLATGWYMRDFFNLLVLPAGTVSEGVFLRVIVLVGIMLTVAWAARRMRGWSQIYLEVSVMEELMVDAFSGLMRHSYQFFSSQFSGTLTRRISKYRDAFETLYDVLTMTLIPLIVFIGGAAVVLSARNLVLGLSFAAWCAGVLWLQFKLAQWRQPLREIRTAEDSAVVGALADAVSNQSAISLFAAGTHETKRLLGIVTRWRKAILRSWIADENIWTFQGLLMIGLNVGMLYGAYVYWRRGMLTVGDFVLIQSYIAGTFDQIFNINRDLRRVYDAFADAGEMAGILERPLDVADPKAPVQLGTVRGEVSFDDVGFRYQGNQSVISDFSLTIRSGEKVALVGSSGAGKSTITKLLLRLFDVTSGSVKIDGIDVRDMAQDDLRAHIAFVPQDPVLFHRTLMDNIRYGRRDATDEEVIEAARKAHCHEFIERLSKGYETYVGERGVKLSGGERQRIAVARAILKNAPILVLDEATSSLDSESEALIQDALNVLMEGKTVIAIAHRLSTIMHMDRILVIEGGRIADQGTHQELLSREGLYQKLWNIQSGGFLVEE
jgi:ATP-binding cassette subfamily B protein